MPCKPPDDVRVWIVPLTASTKRQRRAQARTELEAVLGDELGRAVQDLGIIRADGGKPQLPDRLLNFNLSHSGDIAMIAVSPVRAVGIDVEQARVFRNRDGLVRRICSEREFEHVQYVAASTLDASAELLRLWVRKEAVLKATGEGLVIDLRTLDVLDDELTFGDEQSRWRCVDLPSPAPGYSAAVAFAT